MPKQCNNLPCTFCLLPPPATKLRVMLVNDALLSAGKMLSDKVRPSPRQQYGNEGKAKETLLRVMERECTCKFDFDPSWGRDKIGSQCVRIRPGP